MYYDESATYKIKKEEKCSWNIPQHKIKKHAVIDTKKKKTSTKK